MAFCYVKSREKEYRTGDYNKNNHKALGKKNKSIRTKKKRTTTTTTKRSKSWQQLPYSTRKHLKILQ